MMHPPSSWVGTPHPRLAGMESCPCLPCTPLQGAEGTRGSLLQGWVGSEQVGAAGSEAVGASAEVQLGVWPHRGEPASMLLPLIFSPHSNYCRRGFASGTVSESCAGPLPHLVHAALSQAHTGSPAPSCCCLCGGVLSLLAGRELLPILTGLDSSLHSCTGREEHGAREHYAWP